MRTLLVGVVLAACGGSSGGGDPDGAGRGDARVADARVLVNAPPPGPCGDVWTETSPPPGAHFEVGTPIEWPTNPPTGGPHWPVWVRWGTVSETPIERGYWVHNTEHGGVILLYRCDGGCPEVADALAALQGELPEDPLCQAPLRTRTLVTPDPLLPDGVQVAASAWGASYTATCFDGVSLRAWIDGHYAQGPEDTCAQGGAP